MGVKISELAEAMAAQNTDEMPIVQNGETKKINVETLMSNLQTQLTNLQNQVNDKNAITIGLNADTTTTSTSAYQNIDISLTKEMAKIGTKLSLSNGKVLIGEGVSHVLVSGKIQTQGDNSAYGLSIRKNTISGVSDGYESTPGNSWNQLTAPSILIPVVQGDTIKMTIYHNVSGTTKNIKAYNGYGTYLTVEAID